MLYKERKRLRERAEAEAGGKSFWTSAFDEKVRHKLLYATQDAAQREMQVISEMARRIILTGEGLPWLIDSSLEPHEDFGAYYFKCPDDDFPMVVEGIYRSMWDWLNAQGYYGVDVRGWEERVRKILEEDRIAFDFAGGEMVPFESKELHEAIMAPALTLLRDPGFASAQTAYQHALEEVTKGKPGDAITDAGTALQELLVALGCDGNSLGPLIKSAKAKGLLGPHDATLTRAIEDTMSWVSANRSEKGDAHKADAASNEDAWLMIHVVGALMVRLGTLPGD